MNQRQTLLCGSLLGLLGVGIGAFAAHGLKGLLVQNGRLETFELAVRYQFYHALALMLIGLLMEKMDVAILKWAALLTFVGVIFFSGSLYLFAVTNFKTFAVVTPLGGLLMLFGWSGLVYAVIRRR